MSEKMAEKIVFELTTEQDLIFAQIEKIEILEADKIQVPEKFNVIEKALKEVKKLRKELKIEEGDILSVENTEERDKYKKIIDDIKGYTKPIKDIRAAANKEYEKQKKMTHSKFNEVVSELTIIQKVLENSNSAYKKREDKIKRDKKIKIFNELKEQYKDFPIKIEFKEDYTGWSRERIEADILSIKDAYIAEQELYQHKISTVKLQLIEQQEAYTIKNKYKYEDIERIMNLKEMNLQDITAQVEELISVQADKEFREAEKEERKAELLKKQKEYEENQALEFKNKTIELILKFKKHKKDKLEEMEQGTLTFIYNELQNEAIKEAEEERARIKKEQEKEAEKKRIADEEKAEKERVRKEAENAKSKTLLISVECIDKYTDDFKTELEEFLQSKAVVKKYAVKVKGE